MRKLLLAFSLLAPLQAALAASVHVDANTVLSLPVKGDSLSLERISVAAGGALLIPAQVSVLRVEQLELDKNARLGVFPGERPLRIEVLHGQLADGSVIAAQGAAGSFHRPASAGRTLVLRLQDVTLANLLVDVRGGVGAPGYDGLDGANAKSAGCLWGSEQSAGDGQDGSAGQNGGAGGQVRLEVPAQFPLERVKVRLEGGAGGAGGKPGQAGASSVEKGCWIYSTTAGAAGRAGRAGAEGKAGGEGRLEVQRF